MAEIEFAKGDTIGTQNLRITYECLDPLQHPKRRFPSVYVTRGDGSVYSIGMTPEEGRWVAEQLTRMFRE